jgi:polyisoprenoid-binding protein YceI
MASLDTVSTSAAGPAATTWQIDPAHTQVEFAVRHLMISTVRGRFSDVSGQLIVPGGDFSKAQLEAAIGVASLDTREPQRDAHLRSADFFDAERFPTIAFKSRAVESDPKRADRYVLVGDLTIHGVTREVRLDVTAEGRGRDPWGNERAGYSISGKINRSDFGLTWNQALETGGVLVGDEVKLAIETELIAKAAEADA